MSAVKDGTVILLSVNGERVSALVANDETYATAMRDVTTKESLGESESAPGLRSADLNCSGLFFEQLKNLLKKSEGFDNSIWVKDTGVTVAANVDSAPVLYNRKTVDEITWGAGTYIQQAIPNGTFLNTDIVVFSLWVKGSGTINLECSDDSGFPHVSSTITLTSTLTRYEVSYAMSTANNVYVKINKLTGTKVRVWGAQLELGTVATSYFPSGQKLQDLITLEQAGTKIPCIVSSFVSGEITDSMNAYISSIKKTNAQNANVTFTCTLKITGAITDSTI